MKRFNHYNMLRAAMVAFAICTLVFGTIVSAVGQKQKSLYERLGGYDAIAAVSDDFIARLAANPKLSKFLAGLSKDSQKKLRQHLVDLICEATGGPCAYIGRTMKASHEGLGISEDDWQAGVNDLVATLDKFKVPAKEKGELLATVSSLKKDIVEK